MDELLRSITIWAGITCMIFTGLFFTGYKPTHKNNYYCVVKAGEQ